MRLRWVAAVLAAVALLGMARLSFEGDVFDLLPDDLPQVRGLRVFLEHFSNPGQMVVTVSGEDADVVDNAARRIASRLAEAGHLAPGGVVDAPPWEKNPAELVEMAAFLSLNRPSAEFQNLLDGMSSVRRSKTLEETLQRLRESVSPTEVALLSNDPYRFVVDAVPDGMGFGEGVDGFSNADGTFRVLYVETDAAGRGYREIGRIVDGVIAVSTRAVEGLDVVLGFTGEPAFVAGISRAMQRDMVLSGGVALVLVGLIFWLCYRRVRPLAALIFLLLLTFAVTLGAAGFIAGKLTAIGVGCAAILIGLSVDYGYFIFEKSRTFRGTASELRLLCLKTLLLTAGTTAGAFFLLAVADLPGLSQLGLLVGVGVIAGLGLMLIFFAPVALRWSGEASPGEAAIRNFFQSPKWNRAGAAGTAAVLCSCLVALVVKGAPDFDFSPTSLRPGELPAYEALETMTRELSGEPEVLHLLVAGESLGQVRERLGRANERLAKEQMNGGVLRFRTAWDFWPRDTEALENLALTGSVRLDKGELEQAAFDVGFTREAFALDAGILDYWKSWRMSGMPDLPENEASRWIIGRFARVLPDGTFLASGLVVTAPGKEAAVAESVAGEGVLLTGWPLLGGEIAESVVGGLLPLALGLAVVVLGILGLVLRSFWSVLAFAFSMALSICALLGAMSLAGISWNIFSLAAILLLLGTGTDYSMMMFLALKRSGGDACAAQRDVSLVIALCALSAVAGFGSIGFASHAGLATLGKVASMGLALNAAVALFLVPLAVRRSKVVAHPAPSTNVM